MAIVARAQYIGRWHVKLTFPYEPRLIEALKAQIPATLRTYDPQTKTWIVFGGWQEDATRLLLKSFPDARIDGLNGNHAAAPSHGLDAQFAQLHLLPSAPGQLIDAAYRVLAKRHHPDAGGDNAQMQRLNSAYAMLKARGET